ncbi:MAG: enoyl-CoA hydratase/isomerase family protein [Gammaproteobacteria bacterium]|nr:enoyl-CoA hydratase/isomerase family protein [Gammaproteobacteria bacterium]
MSAPSPVLFEELPTANGLRLGVARLNAETSLNALTLEMVDLLWSRLQLWASAPDIALVLLEGAGERALCAGADLNRLHAACLAHHAGPAPHDVRGNQYALDFFSREYRLDYFLHTYPKPLLCWGHGVVMGGGVGLLAGASHRVVTGGLRLAMPEINIGLYPDVGGSWFLARAPGKTGIFLALTAAQLNASDAIFAGLADLCIPHADKARVLHALTSHAWWPDAGRNHADLTALLQTFAQAPASGPLRAHFDAINAACSHADPVAIVQAVGALARLDEWFARGAATLRAGSPSSAVLSIALQRRLRLASLADVFRAELVAALTCAARPDLAEGIRALLIDKDKQPHWQPADIAAITPALLDAFFATPWPAAEHPLASLGAA